MTAERVLAGLLEPGDVICVQHHHDSRCGECLAPWQTQAVITGRPAPVSGRLVVSWAGHLAARRAGGRHRGQLRWCPGPHAYRSRIMHDVAGG